MSDSVSANFSNQVVLNFGASDPTGGGGIQSAIEVLRCFSIHPATVITAITVQDTEDLQGYAPLDPDIIVEQARAILEDMPVSAFLIGMLGNAESIEAVNSIIIDYPDTPVILAPSFLSSAGTLIVETETLDSLVGMMLPLTTMLILNSHEAQILSPSADSIEACASYLLEQGAEYVIITGSKDFGAEITTTLFSHEQIPIKFASERLNRSFHGAGCTLAAAITAGFVHEKMIDAVFNGAIQFTQEALKHGYRLGMGKELPDRFFWLEHELSE